MQPDQPVRVASAFASVLRAAGLVVPLSTVITYAEALGVLGLLTKSDVYWAGRAALVRRPEDIAVYDRSFSAFWLDRAGMSLETVNIEVPIILAVDDPDDEGDDHDPADSDASEEIQTVRFSALELLHEKDFADFTDEEFD